MTKNRFAVDTNVLIYVYDSVDIGKQSLATDLMSYAPHVSAQVVSEFFNVLQRRFSFPKAQALQVGIELLADCPIAPTTHATLDLAARLLARYDFQLFDAIIVAAALEAGCTVLYSADFQHQQLVESRLRLLNPFK